MFLKKKKLNQINFKLINKTYNNFVYFCINTKEHVNI